MAGIETERDLINQAKIIFEGEKVLTYFYQLTELLKTVV